MKDPFWTGVAQVLVDALDVDARILQGRLFEQLRRHPSGQHFQRWAAANPAAFEVLVRALSVFAKTYGRSLRTKGTLATALASQLEQMPFEFRAGFRTSTDPSQHFAPAARADRAELNPSAPGELSSVLEELRAARAEGESLGFVMQCAIRAAHPPIADEVITRIVEREQESLAKGLGPHAMSRPQWDVFQGMLFKAATTMANVDAKDLPDPPLTPHHEMIVNAVQPYQREKREQGMRGMHDGLRARTHAAENWDPTEEQQAGLALGLFSFLVVDLPDDLQSEAALREALVRVRQLWSRESRPKSWLSSMHFFERLLDAEP